MSDIARAVEFVADSLQMQLHYDHTPLVVNGSATRTFSFDTDEAKLSVKMSPKVIAQWCGDDSRVLILVKMYGNLVLVFDILNDVRVLHLIAPSPKDLESLLSIFGLTTTYDTLYSTLKVSSLLESYVYHPILRWQQC